MEQNHKILNNSFNNETFGMERTNPNATISVHPVAAKIYEESTTDDIESVINKKRLDEILYKEYLASHWYTTYGIRTKIPKSDMCEIYYYFKNILIEREKFNYVETFCAIAEFFKFNYETLYEDIISIEDKANILDTLKNEYGISNNIPKEARLY